MSGSGIQTQPFLTSFRTALAATVAGTGRTRIAFLGDSTFTGEFGNNINTTINNRQYAMGNFIASAMSSLGYNTNVDNLFCDNNTSSAGTTLPFDPKLTFAVGGNWTFSGGGATQWTVGGNILNASNIQKVTYAPAAACNRCDLFYVQNAGYGTLGCAIDGGGYFDSVNQAGALSVQKKTFSFAVGKHVLNFGKTIGDGMNVDITGIVCYNTLAPAVECWNWGIGTASAGTWAQTGTVYNPSSCLATYAPDLTVMCLTINDSNTGAPNLATITANWQIIYNQAIISGPVIICPGNYIGTANGLANQQNVINVFQSFASQNNARFVNFNSIWPSFAVGNAAGWMNATGDTIHPNASGYQVRSNTILPYILG